MRRDSNAKSTDKIPYSQLSLPLATAAIDASLDITGQIDAVDLYIVKMVLDVSKVSATIFMLKLDGAKPCGPQDDTWEPVSSLPVDVCNNGHGVVP